MLYEYRRYEVVPGKLAELHHRLGDIALPMFTKHGIEVIGFWVADVGANNAVHYIIRWNDSGEREAKWAAFLTDPEWLKGSAGTEVNGPVIASITNELWKPTNYSAMK